MTILLLIWFGILCLMYNVTRASLYDDWWWPVRRVVGWATIIWIMLPVLLVIAL